MPRARARSAVRLHPPPRQVAAAPRTNHPPPPTHLHPSSCLGTGAPGSSSWGSPPPAARWSTCGTVTRPRRCSHEQRPPCAVASCCLLHARPSSDAIAMASRAPLAAASGGQADQAAAATRGRELQVTASTRTQVSLQQTSLHLRWMPGVLAAIQAARTPGIHLRCKLVCCKDT